MVYYSGGHYGFTPKLDDEAIFRTPEKARAHDLQTCLEALESKCGEDWLDLLRSDDSERIERMQKIIDHFSSVLGDRLQEIRLADLRARKTEAEIPAPPMKDTHAQPVPATAADEDNIDF